MPRETYAADCSDAALDSYDATLMVYNARVGLTGVATERVLARPAGPQACPTGTTLRDSLPTLGLPSR